MGVRGVRLRLRQRVVAVTQVLNGSWGTNNGFDQFNADPLVTGSFSPAAGDLIVVKLQGRADSPSSWTMSDSASALTWTKQVDYVTVGGNVRIFTRLSTGPLARPGRLRVARWLSGGVRTVTGELGTAWSGPAGIPGGTSRAEGFP